MERQGLFPICLSLKSLRRLCLAMGIYGAGTLRYVRSRDTAVGTEVMDGSRFKENFSTFYKKAAPLLSAKVPLSYNMPVSTHAFNACNDIRGSPKENGFGDFGFHVNSSNNATLWGPPLIKYVHVLLVGRWNI